MYTYKFNNTCKCDLSYYRTRSGLSQTELAKKCNTSQATISSLENGTYSCTITLALLISKVLDVPVSDLFYLV